MLRAAGIGTMKENVQEEKYDASVFMQSLKSICSLEEKLECRLVFLRFRGSRPKDQNQVMS